LDNKDFIAQLSASASLRWLLTRSGSSERRTEHTLHRSPRLRETLHRGRLVTGYWSLKVRLRLRSRLPRPTHNRTATTSGQAAWRSTNSSSKRCTQL